MTTTVSFAYTGANQSWVVPAGVTSVQLALNGAGGGNTGGAAGERIVCTVAVTPGDTWTVQVGGKGGNGGVGTVGAGGWPNGGTSGVQPASLAGGGGGGSTEFRRGSVRIVAGAGGGGSGGNVAGGQGGTTTGQAGTASGGGGGGGGTPSAGGAGGTAGSGGVAGAAGSVGGQGGNGGAVTSSVSTGRSGGGGGGGLNGGGGGGGNNAAGTAGGGGGGSGSTAGATGVTDTRGGGSAAQTHGALTITFNQPPNAPTLSLPASNAWLDVAVAQTLATVFSDPDVTDSVSATDFQYRIVGAGTWTAVSSLTASTTLAAGTLVTGNQYEWQARSYDSSGAVGPWASSKFFRTTTAPATAPTITAPANGSALQGNLAALTWTTPTTQASYEIQVNPDASGSANTAVVITDTGEVVGTTQTANVDVGTAFNGQSVHRRVRYSEHAGSGIWSPWADNGAQLINYSPPNAPTLVLTPNLATAAVTVVITNPAGGAAAASNDLYRTDLGNGTDEIRIATGLAANATFVDQFAPFNTSLRYRAVAFNIYGAYTSST